MSGRHTAGPWQRGHMGDGERAWIGPVIDHMPETPVAHVDRIDRDNWEANAALIAAAPELLDVAHRLVKLVEGLNCTAPEPVVDGWMEDYRVARAVIARAEATTHDD